MYPPRVLTVNGRVSHLGVNIWSRRPWSSGTEWWPRRRGRRCFRCHSGLVSGRHGVRTWLHGGYCIPCWFANWHGVFVDRLLGHFRGPIPSAWGFILGAVLLPWVDGQFCGRFHGRLIVIRDCVARGVDLGWWLHLPWHGGPILVTFEAGCAWSS